MIERSFDVQDLNAIANNPDILSLATEPGTKEIDLTAQIENRANIALRSEGGFFLCIQHEPGTYEVHTLFLPNFRGKYALDCAREGFRYMFLQTDCMEILTKVPVFNRRADKFTRLNGFSLDFERDNAWVMPNGHPCAVRYYGLRYEEWIRNQDWLRETGQWFHDKLGETQTHDEDLAHDLRVGATVKMIQAGQVAKGIVLYNRWARFAGYMPISRISEDPLVIDIVSHTLLVEDGDFLVLEDRSKEFH